MGALRSLPMTSMSRRNVLRLFGGAAGLAGASVAAGPGLFAPTFAAPARETSASATTSIGSVLAAGTPLIGMSSPVDVWAQRVREVGPGLAARRIFADLGSGATSQLKLVEQAHAAGMLPVISYKVGGDVAGAASGRYNAVAEQGSVRC